MSSKPLLFIFLLILILAGYLRYPAFLFGFPYIEHPDEPHYNLAASSIIEKGNADDLGMSGYPPGIIYTNIFLIKFFHNPNLRWSTDIIPLARLLSITFGGLGVISCLFALGAIQGKPFAGILASFLWAITPVCVEYDRFACAEPYMAFFLTLTFVLIFYSISKASSKIMNLAYVSAMLTISFKYQAALVIIPLVLSDVYLNRHLFMKRYPLFSYAGPAARMLILVCFGILLVFGFDALASSPQPEWCWRRHMIFAIPGIGQILNNIKMILFTFSNPSNLFSMGTTGEPPQPTHPFLSITFAFILLYVFIDSIRLNKPRMFRNPAVLIMLSFVLFWIIFVSFFNPAFRHILPVMPLVYISLAIGITSLLELLKNHIFVKASLRKFRFPIYLILSCIFLAIVTKEFLIPSYLNMKKRSKPDIRNEIIEWMNKTLELGEYCASSECGSMFLGWGGYQGETYFSCQGVFDLSQEVPDVQSLRGKDIDYIIINNNSLKENKKYAHYIEKLCKEAVVLKTFPAGDKFYGDDYFILSTKPIEEKLEIVSENTVLVGLNKEIQSKGTYNTLYLTLFFKFLKPSDRPLNIQIYLTNRKTGKILSHIEQYPLFDEYRRRATLDFSDPEEIIRCRPFSISVQNSKDIEYSLFVEFAEKPFYFDTSSEFICQERKSIFKVCDNVAEYLKQP
jgi:4-amino-4-deoxy-L-arabinose transferase-like glycosyltransferase